MTDFRVELQALFDAIEHMSAYRFDAEAWENALDRARAALLQQQPIDTTSEAKRLANDLETIADDYDQGSPQERILESAAAVLRATAPSQAQPAPVDELLQAYRAGRRNGEAIHEPAAEGEVLTDDLPVPALHTIPLQNCPALTVTARQYRGDWLVYFARKDHPDFGISSRWHGPGHWDPHRWNPAIFPAMIPPAALVAVEAWLLEQRP